MPRSDRFVWKANEAIWPQCFYCQRLEEGQKCEAFPKGIPQKIIDNKKDHRKLVLGDHGLRFELNPGMASEYKQFLKMVGWK